MDFTNVNENMSAFPPGRYKAKIIAATAKSSKVAGDGMITLTIEIAEGEYAKRQVFDNIMTTGKGAPMGKKKMRGIIGDEVDTARAPDGVVANRLLELMILVDVDQEPAFGKDAQSGAYTVPQFEINAAGERIRAQKNVVKHYYTLGAQQGVIGNTGVTPTANGGLLQQLPQSQPQFAPPPQFQAPTFQPQQLIPPPIQQFQQAPQQIQQAPQQFIQPQYAQPAQQPAPVQVHQPQPVTSGYITPAQAPAQPQQAQAPQMQFTQPPIQAQQLNQAPAQAQAAPASFQAQASTPPWIAAQQAPGTVQGQVEAGANSTGKRGKKS